MAPKPSAPSANERASAQRPTSSQTIERERMRYQSSVVTERPAVRRILLPCAAILLALESLCFAADLYLQASVDQTGQLRIVTKDGREIVPKKETEQVGFDKVAISNDGQSVGWVALYPNCCTSYPIPLKLMIYSSGRLRTFTGRGLPLWLWGFQADGKQVAFEQETVHGSLGIHYELRDVTTGRLIAEYNPPYDRDNRPIVKRDVPKWVDQLNAK